MPWDGTFLRLGRLSTTGNGPPTISGTMEIAGGTATAILQPEFTPDGEALLYVSDETGWGRLRSTQLATGESRWLTPAGVEQGWPAWAQDMRTYAVAHDGSYAVTARNDAGFQRLWKVDLQTGDAVLLPSLEPYSEIATLHASPDSHRVVFVGSGPKTPKRLVEYDVDSHAVRIVARTSGETVAAAALSDCEPVAWETTGSETAYGLFYAPASDCFTATGKPPVVALIHGGPTGQRVAGWLADAQFFATRGYAVLVVNYRGSTGYGRDYMLRLRGNWGLCDVEDSISGVKSLAEQGRIDPDRAVIMGGSAGGFTVLQTLSQYPESFTAGISLYGVANQFHLAAETHKFEARYLDTMLGPLPEAAAIYHERSPQYHADRIKHPLAVFQGEIDRVVPKAQSDAIVAALSRNGTPHIYHCYADEGHGWRKRETIEHFYTTVDQFLREHVVFSTPVNKS